MLEIYRLQKKTDYVPQEHPNIVDIEIVAIDGTKMSTINAENIDPFTSSDTDEVIRMINSVLSALVFLHDQGIVHRYLRQDHIFITESGEIKLLICPPMEDDRVFSFETSRTISPERVEGKPYDGKADVWSLGVIVYHLLTGQSPWPENDFGDFLDEIVDGKIPPLSDDFPEPIRDFVAKCMTRNLDDRPTASDLMDHQIFQIGLTKALK